MQTEIKTLPKSEVEIKITLQPEEIQKDIEGATKRLSESSKISGFRPGHAPYDLVKARVGEMKIWEDALETIIRRTYSQALEENKLTTVGQPYFSVLNLAPGNPIIYSVKTAVLPKITKLTNYRSLKIPKKEIKIEEKDVEAALKQLSRRQIKESEIENPAGSEDKVVVDMSIFLDKVPLDGGVAKGHGIYLSEEYYVPGLNEKLIGIKKGETRKFSLEFPKDHFQKNIAGKMVEFKVTATAIYKLDSPILDDSFAKSLGQETVDALRAIIGKNLEAEAEFKEKQREEIEILERLADESSFDEIPDALINTEIERMLHELAGSITAQGLEWNKYLESIKKTVPQLKLDFSARALKRVKIALIIREIAQKENIEADDAQVSLEIEQATNDYKDNADAQKAIRSEEYSEEARTVSRNKKTIDFLRELIVK